MLNKGRLHWERYKRTKKWQRKKDSLWRICKLSYFVQYRFVYMGERKKEDLDNITNKIEKEYQLENNGAGKSEIPTRKQRSWEKWNEWWEVGKRRKERTCTREYIVYRSWCGTSRRPVPDGPSAACTACRGHPSPQSPPGSASPRPGIPWSPGTDRASSTSKLQTCTWNVINTIKWQANI